MQWIADCGSKCRVHHCPPSLRVRVTTALFLASFTEFTADEMLALWALHEMVANNGR